MKRHSKEPLIVFISGATLLGSYLAWLKTNNPVGVCSSGFGHFAQALSNSAYDQCQNASEIHTLGITGMVLSAIALASVAAVHVIRNRSLSSNGS